ncbi:hypothetical protein JMUB5695_04336 [Mycobacterium heckeshornense]|uniref:Uncharacterized protein n=1 Tax=Mycobacterium heckeshornense TaxID=110505 RepID=A0A7R7YTL9_9MYCO|nr:hypothetical protein MHEC_44460 [Mycobacterium heckeshornense]BCQ10877.1 hypothetical protein JMUB5695_04336 [Mycobacterium heckeshornense]
MLVVYSNAVKVESVPLKFGEFSAPTVQLVVPKPA